MADDPVSSNDRFHKVVGNFGNVKLNVEQKFGTSPMLNTVNDSYGVLNDENTYLRIHPSTISSNNTRDED